MKKRFKYILMILCYPSVLSELLNNSCSKEDLDKAVLAFRD